MAFDRPFDPETKIVLRSSWPDVIERGCDICVVGSGVSGMSAAVEAARVSRSVHQIDIGALKQRIAANIEV